MQSIKKRSDNNFARLKQKGFTLIEVMMAFGILLVVIGGMVAALTSSLRVTSVQRQRTLAQDVVRDVATQYLRNEEFETVYPFDDPSVTPGAHYGGSTSPYKVNIYKVTGANTEEDHLSTFALTAIKDDLRTLRASDLHIDMRPIRAADGTFYDTKFNAVVRLTWGAVGGVGARVSEMPVLVAQSDVSRAKRAIFQQPQTPPPPPAEEDTGGDDTSGGGGSSGGGTPTDPPPACTVGTIPAGTPCTSKNHCEKNCCDGTYTQTGTGSNKVFTCN